MNNNSIKDLLRTLGETGEEIYAVLVRVDTVDRQTGTCDCTPLDGDAEIFDVRLQASAGDGVLVVPKEGTTAVVSFLSRTTAFLALASEVEEIRVKIGGISMVLSGQGAVFNGGELGGLVKIEALEKNLKSLKEYAEAINAALPGAFTAIGGGTAALGENGATKYAQGMAGKAITLGEMEDTNVKH